jgi:adenylate cyclase, class 2
LRHLNVEFKARCADLDASRETLRRLGATGPTIDHQIDTYFVVPHGRLKLREGTVERALIHYQREDSAGPKRSEVTLFPVGEDSHALKEALSGSLGVQAVVDKHREIWWLDNVKLHLDRVIDLGTFVEVEAIAREGLLEDDLRAQCERLLAALGVRTVDLISVSYCDLSNRGNH